MKHKIGVRVMPREVILDTQGRAVEQSLKLEGYHPVRVRVGKFIELEIDGPEEKIRETADKIAKSVLHNPLIETYTLEGLKS